MSKFRDHVVNKRIEIRNMKGRSVNECWIEMVGYI